jgi:hypothetical protein
MWGILLGAGAALGGLWWLSQRKAAAPGTQSLPITTSLQTGKVYALNVYADSLGPGGATWLPPNVDMNQPNFAAVAMQNAITAAFPFLLPAGRLPILAKANVTGTGVVLGTSEFAQPRSIDQWIVFVTTTGARNLPLQVNEKFRIVSAIEQTATTPAFVPPTGAAPKKAVQTSAGCG